MNVSRSVGRPICYSENGVAHSRIQPDGDLHVIYNAESCLKIESSVAGNFEQCDKVHNQLITQHGEPQVETFHSKGEFHFDDRDCQYHTIYHYANGQLRVEKVELSGDC